MILASGSGSIPNWIFDLSPKVIIRLADPAARSLAIASVAGFVMVIARVKNLSLRLSVWKAVVCAALAMPILVICLPPLSVSLPVPDRIQRVFGDEMKAGYRAPVSVIQSASRTSNVVSSAPGSMGVRYVARPATGVDPRNSGIRATDVPWSIRALGIYLSVALFLEFRFLVGWFLSQKLRRSSRPILDKGVVSRFQLWCNSAQLPVFPHFAESDRIHVPLTCGVAGASVLLPADWRAWDVEKLNAVLAHEISHVSRRDALTERLALLHRVIFWFSPLAWWLPRRLADLAEEASDEAALAAGTEPTRYAEILLGFLEDLNCASRRAHWQGVAMAQAGSAEKRLDRILNGSVIMSSKAKKSVLAVLTFASVPVVLLAASLQPHRLGPQLVFNGYSSRPVAPLPTAQSSAQVSPTPAVAPPAGPRALPNVATVAAPAAESSALPAPTSSAVQEQAPAPPSSPVPAAPQTEAPPPVPAAPRSGYSFSFSTDRKNSYAIITGKTQTVSGSFARGDFAQLEALRNKINSDFVWFERDGKSYVITDPETVKRTAEAWAAQVELSKQQGELGEREGTLGELQGLLGEQQIALGEQTVQVRSDLGNIKVQLPDLTSDLQEVMSKTRELSQAISQKDMNEMRASIAQMQKNIAAARAQIQEAQIRSSVSQSVDTATIEAAMEQARAAMDEQMAKFSAEQAKLGEQQEKLGKEQAEIGRRQGEAGAKAEAEIKTIINDAISRGIAQPAPKQ